MTPRATVCQPRDRAGVCGEGKTTRRKELRRTLPTVARSRISKTCDRKGAFFFKCQEEKRCLCRAKKIKTRQRLFILTGASGCEQILASPEVQTPQRAPGPPEQLYLIPANLWLLDGEGGGGGS